MSEPAPVTVLLIEDLTEHVLLVERALRTGAGGTAFVLERAPALGEGLARLARGGIDAVLVDLLLPDASGLEAVRAVREAEPRVPIVVLTAVEGDDVPLQALQAGAQDYIPKSVLVGTGGLVPRTLRMAIERVRLEAALAEARRAAELSERQLDRERELGAAILDAEDAVVLVMDPLGRVVRHNRKAEEVLGPPASRRSMHVSDVLELLHRSGALSDLMGVLAPTGEGGVVETTFQDEGGEERTLVWHASSMPLSAGGSSYAVLVGADVTEHRRLEARLRERQKLEALGALTGGIAHDFNNVLSVIAVNAEMVARDVARGAPVESEALGEVLSATRRARNLVSRLMVFARTGSDQREPVDLGSLLRDLDRTLARVFPETIQLRLELAPDLPTTVMADPVALHQALVNVATNARDAAHDVGTIWITAERVSVEEREAGVYPWVRPGPFVRIRVRDEGEGMDPEILSRAVEPFFTTKPAGKGTGLGLPIVYATARQHKGFVTLQSAPGRGCTVDVHVPIGADAPASSRPERRPAEAVRGGLETILLVEDEAALRRAAMKVLERFGYHVLTAVDGEDALDVWRRHGGRVDVVISDVVMPRRGGSELLTELRRLGCRAPFILTSGYGEGVQGSRASRLARATMVLPKPWSVDSLAGAVRRVLDQAG